MSRLRETDYPGGIRYIVGPIRQAREAYARTMQSEVGARLVFEQFDYTADRAVISVQLPRSE